MKTSDGQMFKRVILTGNEKSSSAVLRFGVTMENGMKARGR